MAAHQNTCEICTRIQMCQSGAHPGLIMEMDTAFAVLGDSQFFLGYSLLLCKEPATELDELPHQTRLRYLEEMAELAAAVRTVTRAHKINYEALGNIVHHMHWHIFPRQLTDPAPEKPVWVQMPDGAEAVQYRLDAGVHRELLERLQEELIRIRGGS